MKKKKPYGQNLREQLVASSRDQLYSFFLDFGGIRGALVHATRMVNEMRANHELGTLETLLLGHAYIAASLMTVNLKGGDRVTIRVDCSGPAKGLSVEANAFGEVRGYLMENPIQLDRAPESFELRELMVQGVLSVTRLLEKAKQPFTGQVQLQHGTLAEDLAYYYLVSEQTPSAFTVSVQFDANGEVSGAGGLFLQIMPGTEEYKVVRLEQILAQMPSLGRLFAEQLPAEQLLQDQFADLSPIVLGKRRVAFMCHCSKSRFRRFMAALPPEELTDILENGPFPVVTTCFNCNSQYNFPRPEIETILAE
ncbi:MAG: Hsp33 family molecular chaperone HslO, partial [Spirochaetaceae bacterium]